MGLTSTREIHVKPVPNTLESKQTLGTDPITNESYGKTTGQIQTTFPFRKLMLLL